MAPLKKPEKLQFLCIETVSEYILSYALRIGKNLNSDHSEFLKGFIETYVCTRFRSEIFHITITKLAKRNLHFIKPETIVILIDVLLHPGIEKLKLSDLAFAGGTSYETLDLFETVLSENLPILPHLSELDLSTHRTESSLPSCSYNLLKTISDNFLNLKVLDLNHNNRVTGEGLKWLAPTRYGRGCPYLEKIYVQDCSLTRTDIVWLLFTFKRLLKIGYNDMGTILQMLKTHCRRRKVRNLQLNLISVDNSESTSHGSDTNIIHLVNQMCPHVNNLRIRVQDGDCRYLYNLKSVTKLELRFYTGIHHPIGYETLRFIRSVGFYLKCLTIYCNILESSQVTTIASSCPNLDKLYLFANQFDENDLSMMSVSNNMSKLKVLSLRIGKHEMDFSPTADLLALYLIGPCYNLEKLYLLLCCTELNNNFLDSLFNKNPLNFLKLLICDAPRRNVNLSLLHFDIQSALKIIHSCAAIETLGNLISWSIVDAEVDYLRKYITEKNYNVHIIQNIMNKLNKKYFY